MTDQLRLRILAPTTHALLLAEKIQQDASFGVDIWTRPGSLTEQIRSSVEEKIPTLAICALGIIARTLASCQLPNKATTAPLICATENGRNLIPVLGGHKGANALASCLADMIQGQSIITTVSDQRFNSALDIPPKGWNLVGGAQIFSTFMQNLLDQGAADLSYAPLWVKNSNIPHDSDSPLKIVALYGVGLDSKFPSISTSSALVYHSSLHLSIGLGCERNCPKEYILDLLGTAEKLLDFEFEYPLPAASIDLKMDEPAFRDIAENMRFFPAETLAKIDVPNPSEVVRAEVGTASVAEASALALAGKGGELLLPKIKNDKATLAVACALNPISRNDMEDIGSQRPLLKIIGLGPGNEELISGAAIQQIYEAKVWVGYSLYLNQAKKMMPHTKATFLNSNLGDEEARCRAALDEAAKGQRVALICSGDPQIYAMAQVVYELLARHPEREDWQRSFVETLPGITAMQALAAKVGAPMGHDFCAISLSDLNTPWEVIEKKVQAAAEADFVIGFYNPRSHKRDWQLPRALEILRQHRPADCPVACGRNVSRPDEAITRTTLSELNPEDIDMFTCLIIGASFTQRHRDYIFTPRGYKLS